MPCLDGLRALSIGLVLIGHLGGTRGFPLAHGQPFLDRTSAGIAASFPRNLIAVAAYFLVEKPALSARTALEAWIRRAWAQRPQIRYAAFSSAIPAASRSPSKIDS